MNKNTKLFLVVALIFVFSGVAFASAATILHNTKLTAIFGQINSSPPNPTATPTPSPSPSPSPTAVPQSNIVITGGTIYGAAPMNISTEGDIIYFPNFSMTQGATFLVTVDVRNAGPATGTISSPAISGLVDSATNKTVMTCVPQNSYPLVLAKDSTATLIFNCYLVNAGTCNPRLDFNLT